MLHPESVASLRGTAIT